MAATHPVRLPGGAAGQLVLAGGGFMPARLLLAPVGARLPSGVHAVVAVPPTAVVAPGGSGGRAIRLLARAAVPAPVGARLPPGVHAVATVPATAVVAPGGSGGRAIHLLPLPAVPAPGPGEPAADDWEYEWEGAFAFYEFIDTQALDAIRVLGETLLPAAKADAELDTKFKAVQIALNSAVGLAAQAAYPDDKMDLALLVIRGSYGMVKLAHAAYPSDGLPPLPGEQAFISMCLGLADEEQSPPPMILGQAVAPLLSPLLGSKLLGPEVPDADVDLIKSVFVAVAVSQAAARTARASYISGV